MAKQSRTLFPRGEGYVVGDSQTVANLTSALERPSREQTTKSEAKGSKAAEQATGKEPSTGKKK
jgi:hypothetical protein